MSEIDCVDHGYLGEIMGLPGYLLFEGFEFEKDIDRTDGGHRYINYKADKYAVALGGGSGEHPALVVKSLNDALRFWIEHTVSNVFCDCTEDPEATEAEKEHFKGVQHLMPEIQKIKEILDIEDNTILCGVEGNLANFMLGWSVEQYHHFYEINEDYVDKINDKNEKEPKLYPWFEILDVIVYNIAILAINSFPDCLKPDVLEAAKIIYNNYELMNEFFDFDDSIIPVIPGLQHYYGRITNPDTSKTRNNITAYYLHGWDKVKEKP